MTATCSATRRDGRPCETPVVSASRYCFGHDPQLAAKRTEARRRGGENRATAKRLSKIMPARLVGPFELLEQALTDVIDGGLDPRQASAAAAVARALVAVLQAGEVEERLRRLESAHAATEGIAR